MPRSLRTCILPASQLAGSAPRQHPAPEHPPGQRAAPHHRGGCGRCGRAAGTWERADKGTPQLPPTTPWARGSVGGCLAPKHPVPSAERGTELSVLEINHHPQFCICTRLQGRMYSVPLAPNSRQGQRKARARRHHVFAICPRTPRQLKERGWHPSKATETPPPALPAAGRGAGSKERGAGSKEGVQAARKGCM